MSALLRIIADEVKQSPSIIRKSVRGIAHRRLFLALSVTAVLFLSACTRNRETPTPPPKATSAPIATHTATAAATHIINQPLILNEQRQTSTPSPTLSPTPTTTPTPFPTFTPTPEATPFPPGPPTKLGLFVGRNDPALFRLLETGNVALVKTLEYDANSVAEIKQVSPGAFVAARYTPLPLPDFNAWDPLVAAREFVDLLLPIATEPLRQANIDCWESFNEPAPADTAQMASLAMFEAERTRLLAEAGVRSCIGNFSTGQPALELWPAFFPALEAAKLHGGYLGLHEYSAPTLWFASGPHQLLADGDEGDEGWLTLRYRKVYRQYLQPAGLDIPLIITEMGIDGQVQNRPGPAGKGWMDFAAYWRDEGAAATGAPGYYVEQLAWYDAELAKDDVVIGAAIFALAAPPGWHSFEIKDRPFDILKQYLSVH